MYNFLFGPVPSRRLGISLGIDLVLHKTCSLNCIYCECGLTTKLTTERKEYVPVEKIIFEINTYLNENPAPEYITFSGAGEPTLNSGIGKILDFVKINHPEIPVAVLTNGTLLSNKKLRSDIRKADVVLPSLDAATEKTFKAINRPHKNISIYDLIDGLLDFRNEYKGKIYLEVFILPGYNNHPEELEEIKKTILKIKPDKVQLNTIDRPGTKPNLLAATKGELQNIVKTWNMENVEIIDASSDRKKLKSYRFDIESAILDTIARRPCTLTDLTQILGKHENEINKYLDVLKNERRIKTNIQNRGIFYQLNYKNQQLP